MKTLAEISTAILEAEGVRARHDGVHEVHGYLWVLQICHDVKQGDLWLPEKLALAFDDTMRKVRVLNCTGFPPKPILAK